MADKRKRIGCIWDGCGCLAIPVISLTAFWIYCVFSPVIGPSGRFSCASNEKQLGIAFLQYAQDFDMKLPCGLAGGHAGIGWGGQIYN